MGRRRRRRQSWRRVRVRRARRASPPGAARALLPDGRFVRGGRGPRAGDLPASLARARTLRGRFVVPRLAVSHRDERLPRRAPAQIAKATIELAYLAAIQLLPPRQRAVLILRDVLDWSASETASLLDTTVAAANSALQRARATLREQLPARPSDWSAPEPSDQERALLERFIDAHERADADAAVALVREDIRITMPPYPWCYEGLASLLPLLERALSDPGDWRLLPTSANRQPAAASYLREPGDAEYRAFKLDVLRIEDGRIAEITTFGTTLFLTFRRPPTLG